MKADNLEILWAIRAQQWGRVKGELRTMSDMLGAVHPDYSSDGKRDDNPSWKQFEAAAEAFIKLADDEGWLE